MRESDAYRLRAASEWGEATTPFYAVNITPDNAPSVTVTEPVGDIELADPYPSPPLSFNARDDFGISRAVIRYHNEATGQDLEVPVTGVGVGREVSAGGPELSLRLSPATTAPGRGSS